MRTFQLIDRSPCSDVEALLKDFDFMREKAQNQGFDEPWYFRGDKIPPNSQFKPSIGCEQEYGGKKLVFDSDREYKLLHRFRRYAYEYLRPSTSDWEALFLARHYGLPTRLLDWSTSLLIATYFACTPLQKLAQGCPPPEGVVWGILRQPEGFDIDVLDPLLEGPLTLHRTTSGVKLIYPVYNSERLTAQKGIFTWHSQPQVSLDAQAGQDFEDDKLDVRWLVKWPLAFGKQRSTILQKLERIGFSQRTIFPDLQGITSGLWQSEVLFNGT